MSLQPLLVPICLDSTHTSISMNGGEEKGIGATAERRSELLTKARRTRFKWINDAYDGEMNTPKHADPDLAEKIPAAVPLQRMLDYLTDTVNDGETVSVQALVPPATQEDYDENIPIPQYTPTSSHYEVFLQKLRHPLALDIVKNMQQFVTRLDVHFRDENRSARGMSKEQYQEQMDTVWAYCAQIFELMREVPLWQNESLKEWEATKAACEKFLFIKLYSALFATDTEDIMQDEVVAEKLQSLKFLQAEHLDIRVLIGKDINILEPAVKALKKITQAKAPIDKMECIKRSSQKIIEILKSVHTDKSALPGADEYLPVLILVIKEANPEKLASTVSYLQRCIHPSKLVSESGYILTHFISAVHFLTTADSSALTISPHEYERCIAQCRAEAREQTERILGLSAYSPQNLGVPNVEHETSASSTLDSKRKPKQSQTSPVDESLPPQTVRPIDIYKRRCSTVTILSSQPRNKDVLSTDKASSRALQQAFHRYSTDLHEPVLSSIEHADSRTLGFLHSSVESLTVSDVTRLLAEYKYLAKACSVLLSERKVDRRFVPSPSADSLSESVCSR